MRHGSKPSGDRLSVMFGQRHRATLEMEKELRIFECPSTWLQVEHFPALRAHDAILVHRCYDPFLTCWTDAPIVANFQRQGNGNTPLSRCDRTVSRAFYASPTIHSRPCPVPLGRSIPEALGSDSEGASLAAIGIGI
jgi:hypothetical protein